MVLWDATLWCELSYHTGLVSPRVVKVLLFVGAGFGPGVEVAFLCLSPPSDTL